MSDYFTVATLAELPINTHKTIYVQQQAILLIHTANGIYAIQSQCSHANVDLAQGQIKDERIVCPRHGAQFCLKTGAALTAPADEALEIFATKIQDGQIQIQLSTCT